MTESDRELLELAAKAVGGEYKSHALGGMYLAFPPNWNGVTWDPLTDDGDALRLAVVLGLDVTIDKGRSHTWADTHSMPGEALVKELHGNDALAATRRAIVRAAALIGEETP